MTYKSVLGKAGSLWTGEPTPTTEDQATLNVFINQRAAEFWESFWWPEWTVSEKRFFRELWNGFDTYAGPTLTSAVEVYYDGAYYQTVKAVIANQFPAIDGEVNTEYWALSEASYGADDFDDAATYERGDQVYWHETDRYYVLHAALSVGNAPTDTANWAPLTPFVRSIDYEQEWEVTAIGEVKAVWDRDPYVYEEWERCRVEFDLTDRGIVVRGQWPIVWVEFRKRVPSWSATVTPAQHSLTTTYGLNAQVYDDTEGDFFKSLQAANLNHAVTNTAWWERIEFPYVLRDCVPQGAYADMLEPDGQNEKYTLEDAKAQKIARREMRKIGLAQGQSRQLNVVGRY